MPPRHARAALLLAALTLLSLAPGCVTRTVTTPVIERPLLVILLRHDARGGKPVDRGFEQPATIAAERIAHILAALYIRTEEDGPNQQRAAIPSELIFPMAEGLHQALKAADSSQEVAVMAIRKQSRLGLFNDKFLTSFVAFVQEGELYVLLSRVDWNLEKLNKKTGKEKKDKIPRPKIGDDFGEFRVVGSIHLDPQGRTGLSATWRDSYWAQSAHIYKTGTGAVRRRTVLLESEIPEEERVKPLRPDDLPSDPEVLRELAELSEKRANGEITEFEYLRRRAELLEK